MKHLPSRRFKRPSVLSESYARGLLMKRSIKKKSRGKPKLHRPASSSSSQLSGTVKQAALQLAEGAKELVEKADMTHQGVDALHRSIHELREASGKKDSANGFGEDAELVTEEVSASKSLPFPVVGIGASAGGFEALTELLKDLPKDSGMAFVLIQHLDPHY